MTLVVNSTSTPSVIGTFPPPSGTYLEELNVTLSNVGVSKAIGASFQYYTLETDQSLVLQFSTLSDAVDTPCSMSISVANGGSFTCNLVFEVPTGQNPVTLFYDDTVGDTASADLPPPPPPLTCDYDTDTKQTCQQCVYAVSRGTTGYDPAPCDSLGTAWSSACNSTFSDKSHDGDMNCNAGCSSNTQLFPTCACISACSDQQCAAAFKALTDCAYPWCSKNEYPAKGSGIPCP